MSDENKIDDGGPAYPMWTDDMPICGSAGLSIRDYFAAVALRNCNHQGSVEWLASEAYRLADAMLAARKAKP